MIFLRSRRILFFLNSKDHIGYRLPFPRQTLCKCWVVAIRSPQAKGRGLMCTELSAGGTTLPSDAGAAGTVLVCGGGRCAAAGSTKPHGKSVCVRGARDGRRGQPSRPGVARRWGAVGPPALLPNQLRPVRAAQRRPAALFTPPSAGTGRAML